MTKTFVIYSRVVPLQNATTFFNVNRLKIRKTHYVGNFRISNFQQKGGFFIFFGQGRFRYIRHLETERLKHETKSNLYFSPPTAGEQNQIIFLSFEKKRKIANSTKYRNTLLTKHDKINCYRDDLLSKQDCGQKF